MIVKLASYGFMMASSSFASSCLVPSLEYPDIPNKYCHLLLPSLKQVLCMWQQKARD